MSIINSLAGAGSIMPTIRVTAPTGSTVTCDGTQGSPRGTGETQTFDFKVPIKKELNPAYRNLPTGYTQVEWISSSGNVTTRIDTGIVSNNFVTNIKIKTSGDWVSIYTQGYDYGAFGSRYLRNHSDALYMSQSQQGFSSSICSWSNNEVHEITATVNGTTTTISGDYSGSTTYGSTNSNPISLVVTNDNSTSYVYYQDIIIDSVLRLKLIPCLNESTNKYGMYDMVSNTFFGDANGGNFDGGEEVPQYIDTPYTIVSTLGQKSKTVSVVVDEVALFPVEISYSRLPSGLQEVEYIQSNTQGNSNFQYIDANIGTISCPLSVTTKMAVFTTGVNNYLFGVRRVYQGDVNYSVKFKDSKYHLQTVSKYSSSGWLNVTNALVPSVPVTLRYEITSSSLVIAVDDDEYSSTTTSTEPTSSDSFVIGAVTFDGTVSDATALRFYTFSISLNNVEVRNFVPCYCTESVTGYKGATSVTVPANTVGMYDLVNDRFYVNCGSGNDFTKGDDVE